MKESKWSRAPLPLSKTLSKTMSSQDASYIDYEAFLSSDFSPSAFANSLVLSTNNASDSTLDLNTPLSRTLFDLQEVDTHIHNVTTQSALPLLTHSLTKNQAASRIQNALDGQIATLSSNYARLESEVISRHAAAEQVRLCSARLWVTLRIGRAVSRVLALGRRLDSQMAEVRPSLTPGVGNRRGEDYRAMLAATYTLLAIRLIFAADGPGEEGEHLSRIAAVGVLRTDLVLPSENRLKGKAQQIVREFALSSSSSSSTTSAPSGSEISGQRDARSPSPGQGAQVTTQTFAQTVETRSRTAAAFAVLYLLSPISSKDSRVNSSPTLLLTALQTYLQTSLTSSAASLSRALSQLPQLPRALQEITSRCRNIVALENLLRTTEVPQHPLLETSAANDKDPALNGDNKRHANGDDDKETLDENEAQQGTKTRGTLLEPLLNTLDTSSLASFFWRSLASSMGGKVTEIMGRGGAPARSLRSQKDKVRDVVKDAVLRGCEGAKQADGRSGSSAWEREAAVVVASIINPLGR